jgi:hypothetical protein
VIITATPGLASALTAGLAGLLAAFGSEFFVVTGAFDCTDTIFSVAFAAGLAFGAATILVAGAGLTAVFATGLAGAGLAACLLTGFAVALVVSGAAATTLALLLGLGGATTFFAAGFAVDLDAAGFTVFAGSDWVFAGFFIAFAMESTTN